MDIIIRVILLFIACCSLSWAACDMRGIHFIKAHTGSYQMMAGPHIKVDSGAFIEIFEPGERVNVDGSKVSFGLVFGVIYTELGDHFRFIGRITPEINFVKISINSPDNTPIGTGTLSLDPGRCGDAHHISYAFTIGKTTTMSTAKAYVGSFLKNSNTPIKACKKYGNTDAPYVDCVVR